MSDRLLDRPRAPAWLLWTEIVLIVAVLIGLGIASFSRITAAEALEMQLEAGMLQLYELEADHVERTGEYFAPDAPQYRGYFPWLERYESEVRFAADRGFSVVVHADFDDDGEIGAWRVDATSPQVQRVVPD